MSGSLRYRRWVLAILTVAALVASGCADSSTGPERSEGAGDPVATTGGVRDDGRPTTTASDRTGDDDTALTDRGTLRLGLAGPVAVDPALASPADVAQVVTVDLLYDSLTTLGENGDALPGLADFSVNEDLDVWTFQLRADATFADGSAITADDVVFSLQRVMGMGSGWIAAAGLDNLATFSTTGSNTIDIELHRPSAVLAEVLAAPSYGIVHRGTMDALAAGEQPVPNGSGDYAVVDVVGDRMVLHRRNGSGPTEVEVVSYATESDALDAFLAGDVDWTVSPADRLDEAIAAAGVEGIVPFHGALYLAIDSRVAPLGRRGVRTAISLAIDREALVDDVYGPVAQPMLGAIPAGVPGASVDECRTPCGPDRAAAAALLSDALADGQDRPLRILVSKSSPIDGEAGGPDVMARLGRVLAEHLQAAGIDVEVTAEEPETYHQLIASGRQQLYVFSWLGVARTPADYLLPLFETNSPDNLTGFSNANVDDALAFARTSVGYEARLAAWREAESRVLQNGAAVPLVQFRTTSVTQERIRGLVVRVDGSLDIGDVKFAA